MSFTCPIHGHYAPTPGTTLALCPACSAQPITAALQASADPMAAPMWLPWRTGRKVGRTIYAQVGHEPSDDDTLIGVMDTRELADEATRAHNLTLEGVQRD